jgi:hypothetical protein
VTNAIECAENADAADIKRAVEGVEDETMLDYLGDDAVST